MPRLRLRMFALLYYLALGIILVFTHGMYGERQILGLTALHVAFSSSELLRSEARSEPLRGEVLAGMILVASLFWSQSNGLYYAQHSDALTRLDGMLLLVPVAASFLLASQYFVNRKWGKTAFAVAAASLVLLLLLTKFYVLIVSPSPHIDVWTSSQRAIDHFLAGRNPYTQEYDDIYHGQYDYKPGFPYWPSYLYWATLGVVLVPKMHDVRVSMIAAEFLSALCLFGFMKRIRLPTTVAVLISVAWLSSPIDLFILEQAWIDPLLIMGFAATLWALAARKFRLSGAMLGFTFGVKIYAVIGIAFLLLYVWKNHGKRAALEVVIASGAVFAILMGPFIVLGAAQFYRYSVVSWSSALPRLDSLSVPAYFAHAWPPADVEALKRLFAPFGWLSYAIFGAMLVRAWRQKTFDLDACIVASAVVYGFMLLFAKQSFCNYYYFLSFFLLLAAGLRGAAVPVATEGHASRMP